MRVKNLKWIISEICKREGKKSEVNIAQVKEIVGVVCDLSHKYKSVSKTLCKHGKKRALKK